MNRNNLLNLSVDPALPDLLPEGSFFDDIFHLDDYTIAITRVGNNRPFLQARAEELFF